MFCPSCGASNDPGAHFCSGCGKRLDPQSRHSRRRVWVVASIALLFALCVAGGVLWLATDDDGSVETTASPTPTAAGTPSSEPTTGDGSTGATADAGGEEVRDDAGGDDGIDEVEPTVEVPPVVGTQILAAIDEIEAAGLTPHDEPTPDAEACTDLDEGMVWAQAPPGGTIVPTGTGVTLQFCVVAGDHLVAVPPVVGLSEADALAEIEAAGLDANVVRGVDPPGPCDPGDVWQQIPDPGHMLPPNAEVRIYVCD